jgi:hypothetical protein
MLGSGPTASLFPRASTPALGGAPTATLPRVPLEPLVVVERMNDFALGIREGVISTNR